MARAKKQETPVKTTSESLLTASRSINSATTALVKAYTEIDKIKETTLDDLTFAVEQGQARLEEINAQIEATERDQKADLALRIKEHEQKVLDELMDQRGLATITIDDLTDLRGQITALNESIHSQVSQQVAVKVEQATRDHQNQIQQLQLQHKAEIAANEADLRAKDILLERSYADISRTETLLNKHIDAEVKKTENAVNTINVGGPSK